MNMTTADRKNCIVHFKTGALIPLSPEEIKARKAFLEGSSAVEAQYAALVDESMTAYSETGTGDDGRN